MNHLAERKKIFRRRIAFTSLVIMILFLSYLTLTFKNKETKQQEGIQLYKKKVEYLINAAVEKECIIAAEKYAPDKIIIIVSEPGTGKIISSCYTEVDSNNQIVFSKTPQREIKEFRFEAGALVYPITLSIALENNIIGINDSIDCSEYHTNKIRVRDEKPLGKITPYEIIKYSSHIGIAKISEKLQNLDLQKEYSRFGLKYEHRNECEFQNTWSFLCNPIEILQAYSIIANKGNYTPVHFKHEQNSIENSNVMNRKIAEILNKALAGVVNSGTGQEAKLNNITAAGKNGTIPHLQYYGKYWRTHLVLFIGYAPIHKPNYLTLVIVDNPKNGSYYGGLVTAPVFKKIMQTLTQIPE